MVWLAFTLVLWSTEAGAQPTLGFSTYLGGNEFDTANAVAVDAQGFVYLAGQTFSRNFPVANAAQPACVIGPLGSCTDAFVAKIDPSGPRLVWSTYLGRDFGDSARAIAVAADGGVAVTGSISQTMFVARLSPEGRLIYIQQFGQFGVNVGNAIALDGEGNAYIAGQTMDPRFPVSSQAFQRSAGPPSCNPIGGGSLLLDAFVMKLSPAGAVLYSTFLGGNGDDRALGIAVDAAGLAWVAGTTGSTDFPLVGGLQATNAGGAPQGAGVCEGGDAFIARLNEDGSALGFSTYLGGPGVDIARAIAIDSAGNVYLSGQTEGLPGCGDLSPGPFTAKIDARSPRLVYAVSGGGTALALDQAGNAYVGEGAATVLRIDAAGVRAAYYSASFSGLLTSLAIDDQGNVYLAGDAKESLPIQHAIQSTNAGNADAFLIKLEPAPILYSADRSGRGPAAAVALHIQQDGARRTDLTFVCPTPGECRNVPIDLGPESDQVILLLFGTGIRHTRSGAGVKIGGIDAEVLGVAPQPEFPGLDQVNVRLTPDLAGRGEIDVHLTVDGKPANVVTVSVR